MRVAILADGRSPITRGWLSLLTELGYQVHLITTFPCEINLPLVSQQLVPIAFSGMGNRKPTGEISAPGGAGAIRLRAAIRRWLGMATFPTAAYRLRTILDRLDVDLLHALRIPYEGMLAAQVNPEIPLVLSVWGNDFTLHANSTPWMGWLTRRAVRRAHGLHADCQRDVNLSRQWGLGMNRPTVVLPGGGGIDRSMFHTGTTNPDLLEPGLRAKLEAIPPDAPWVINPRGFRAYVRSDTFFQSIPLILHKFPKAIFLAPSMLGEAQANQWITRLGIGHSVVLLPKLAPVEMAALFQRSQVAISPSEHDGTPNTFLEAIACGCFPVVGDLASLREWVQDGTNGLLIDPASPEALAQAVITALRDPGLRSQASAHNQTMIDTRAERSQVGRELDRFYCEVIAQ
ncbi:MAG: glycosyltransferase [Anaerolineales bacterium]|nr:MAG: glycosyltransferase [Anaerolineales bacterium]